jgi:hypothetical protein
VIGLPPRWSWCSCLDAAARRHRHRHPRVKLVDVAARSATTRPTSRSSRQRRTVLGQIVDEAIVQDGYMNALTDGYGGAA